MEAIFCYAFARTGVIVCASACICSVRTYIDWTIAVQLSIVLYQRLRVFYFLLDAIVTSAYIMYRETVQKRMLIVKEFVLRICKHLLSSANCRKRSSIQDSPPAARLCVRHFPNCLDKPQQCKVCTERRRTRICRKTCCSERLVVLCTVDYFSLYHTKLHTSQNS